MANGSRLQARISLNLLIVVSLAATAFWWLSPHTAPSQQEAETAASLMKDSLRPGDALLLTPPWAEAARRSLPEGLPVLSLPPEDLDLELPERLWVLAFPTLAGGEVDETLATLAGRFGPPQVDTAINRSRLLRYTPRGPRPVWRLTEAIASARVSLGGRACIWRPAAAKSARFQCAHAPWTYVGAEIREIDYLPRSCVWAHPATGKILRIEVPEVPRGHRLELRAGVVGSMALQTGDAPVLVKVSRGRDALGQLRVEPRPGWQRTSFPEPPAPVAAPAPEPVPAPPPTPEAPAPEPAPAPPPTPEPPPPLVVEVSAERDGGRHFCLELMAFPLADGEETP